MQLTMPFDAAVALQETSLRHDHPSVWRRYQDKVTIKVGTHAGARIYTQIGETDLCLIRDYLSMWLNDQSFAPEPKWRDEKIDRDNKIMAVRAAIAIVGMTLTKCGVHC